MATLTIGICLTTLAWIIAWGSFGVLSQHSFFPLWLGYILTANGLSDVLFKSSLLRLLGWSFLRLFAISIPLWWFFEGMNAIVENWHYHFARPISPVHYFIEASIDFSTVVPAVLSTSFLLAAALQRFGLAWSKPRVRVSGNNRVIAVLIGIGCFSVLPLFPNETFPLVWVAPILILEPFAFSMSYPSLLRDVETNGWTRLFAVMTATTVTGVFWEMWNYYSVPKWTYTIPYVGFWKVFEMPLLGYLGYPFFGIIVFSYAAIALMVTTRHDLLDLFYRGQR
jgi:hypothetical protein